MPNWCEVDIKITGSKTRMRELLQTVTRETKNNNQRIVRFISWLCPEPPEVTASLAKPESELTPFWYTWRYNNWGTKWDSDLEITKETAKQLVGTMLTAWAPPSEALVTFGQKYPDVKIEAKFFEGGMGFQGILRIDGGQIREYHETKYRGTRGG